MIVIRQAASTDFEGVLILYQQLHEKKHLEREKVQRFYDQLISSDIHYAWVATSDNDIVGYIDVVYRTYHHLDHANQGQGN